MTSRDDFAPVRPPGRRPGVTYAAPFLISNESSYVSAHTPFLDAGDMAGIMRT